MPPRDFQNLSPEQTRAYFVEYTTGLPRRLGSFLERLGQAGGPAAELDLSPPSLVPLWQWFLQELERKGAPPTLWQELPPWYEPDAPGDVRALPRELLSRLGGIADYLSQVLARQAPTLQWSIGKRPKRLRYAYQNLPVLTRGALDIDVPGSVYVAGRQAYFERDREPRSLARVLELWLEDVRLIG